MFTKIKNIKKMKFRTISLALLIATLVLAGCQGGPFCLHPKGDQVTQTIPMESFDGVELAISGNVTIHRDSTLQVKITGHQNIIDNIDRKVVNGVWKIGAAATSRASISFQARAA
jgi:hypothetical protein